MKLKTVFVLAAGLVGLGIGGLLLLLSPYSQSPFYVGLVVLAAVLGAGILVLARLFSTRLSLARLHMWRAAILFVVWFGMMQVISLTRLDFGDSAAEVAIMGLVASTGWILALWAASGRLDLPLSVAILILVCISFFKDDLGLRRLSPLITAPLWFSVLAVTAALWVFPKISKEDSP